jgi:hypothetical protein
VRDPGLRLSRRTIAFVFSVIAALGLLSAALALAATLTWSVPTELPLPSGATTNGTQTAYALGLSCPDAGHCVAVGDYKAGNSGDNAIMAEAETAGGWVATELTPPMGARPAPDVDLLVDSVSCPSDGDCVAVGEYYTATDELVSLIATETDGTWAQAIEGPVPSNAPSIGSPNSVLEGVYCTSVGNCIAVGQYVDADNSTEPMIATQSGGGSWSATDVTPPAGPSPGSGNEDAFLEGVSCSAPSNCIAVGGYWPSTAPDDIQPMAAAGAVTGITAHATELPMPANAAGSGHQDNVEFEGAACTSPGNCFVDGGYEDTGGNRDAVIDTQSGGGAWTTAQVTPPSNEYPTSGGQGAGLDGISCPAVGDCIAVGGYRNNNGNGEPMVVTQSSGWAATGESYPSNAATAPGSQNGGFVDLACTSTTTCFADGVFTDTSGNTLPMVSTSAVSTVSTLRITTTSLAAATAGSAYTAQLAATGGSGGYTWSVTSGALPAGLRLDAATGAIKGTPTVVRRATFTVTVADHESPAQTASAELSIAVKAPRPPHTFITKVHVNKHKAAFSFAASGNVTGYGCSLERAHGKHHNKFSAPRYSTCKSTKTYAHLQTGTYKFTVRAAGLGGNDPAPPSHKFKIS